MFLHHLKHVYQLWLLMIELIVLSTCVGSGRSSTASRATSTPFIDLAPSPSTPIRFGKVDVGGYKINISCVGEGQPVVVFDAGLGESSSTWRFVLPGVGKFTEACAYDRAGLGESDPGPKPTTSAQIATDLRKLLNNAGVTAPFVLVGHSFGGFDVRMFAHKFPEIIAGVVLVDASHPDADSRFQALLPPSTPQDCPVLQQLHKGEPPNQESIDVASSATEAAATGSLGNIPLIVLAHSQALPYPACVPKQYVQQTEQVWRELQTSLVQLSPQGKLVVATHSGHFIQYDQPDLVIDAVRQVVETARGTRP